ncbi:MAG: DUF2283 domain-containing protein [Candidatus Nanohaloarchaea archaeon]
MIKMRINYKPDIDVLVVEKENFEGFGSNLELDGFVLDLDSEGEFLGLEIIDASQKTQLSKEELGSIEDAEVNFTRSEEAVKVQLVLTIESRKNVISSLYPVAEA